MMSNQDNPHKTEQTAAEVFGNLLNQARIRKNLLIGEVAERLKLPSRQIEGMESGDYKDMPEDVFIKGFLTTYARFLELDPDEVQQNLRQIFPDNKQGRTYVSDKEKIPSAEFNFRNAPVRKTVPRWIWGGILLVVIGGVIYAWQSKSSAESAKQVATASQEVTEQSGSAASIAAGNVRVVPMTASDISYSNPMANAASAASDVMASQAGMSADPQNDSLMIKVKYQSWLQVNDRTGKVLFNKLVDNGFSQEFNGGAPYRIIIGYAPGTTITFNGKEVPVKQNNKKTAILTVGGN